MVGGWFGGVAAQPAQDMTGRYLPGYELAGGGAQVKVIFPAGWTYKDTDTADLKIEPVGPTPWAGMTTLPLIVPRKAATGALAATPFAALDKALAGLADGLRAGGHGADVAHAQVRTAQAERVDLLRGDLEADVVDDGRLDPTERQQQMRAMRGLQRHVEAGPDEPVLQALLDGVAHAANELL